MKKKFYVVLTRNYLDQKLPAETITFKIFSPKTLPAPAANQLAIPDEIITGKIYLIRNKKVMLDKDLAELYGVTTGNLNKAVSRNNARFPEDFMFHLTMEEFDVLIFQIGRSSWGGRRTLPYAFTEQGVAMLSGILNSERAIKVNIQIMRVFTKVREIIMDNLSIKLEIEEIKKQLVNHDKNIELVSTILMS